MLLGRLVSLDLLSFTNHTFHSKVVLSSGNADEDNEHFHNLSHNKEDLPTA